MTCVSVVVPSLGVRQWHLAVVERLRSLNHDVYVDVATSSGRRDRVLNGILSFERAVRGSSYATLSRRLDRIERRVPNGSIDLVVDLSRGPVDRSGSDPTITLQFQCSLGLTAAAELLCKGNVPVIDLFFDGDLAVTVAPMTNSRHLVGGGLDDVLARAISAIAKLVDEFETTKHPGLCSSGGGNRKLFEKTTSWSSQGLNLAVSYCFSGLPGAISKLVNRQTQGPDHWRVGFRFLDGAGVAETGSLVGETWTILEDPGDRFYADPFPFEWRGKYFIFVEEVIHAKRKGVISVSECTANGNFEVPRTVLEEPYHLSYPQVFVHGDNIWMIPESGGGRKVSLYRADPFPDRWVEEQVLVDDCDVYDATLLFHDDIYWILGSSRDGAGSSSDMAVVYFAESLHGPWRPHASNPIMIDKSSARPGGGFVRINSRIVLPVQDGTDCYGGGLGLSEVVLLNTECVVMSRPVAIKARDYWPYSRIHTLNRYKRLETIDGLTKAKV